MSFGCEAALDTNSSVSLRSMRLADRLLSEDVLAGVRLWNRLHGRPLSWWLDRLLNLLLDWLLNRLLNRLLSRLMLRDSLVRQLLGKLLVDLLSLLRCGRSCRRLR